MPLLDIARLGGFVNFGQGSAGSLTVPYTFFEGTLAATSESSGFSVPANFDNLTIVLKRPSLSNGTQVILQTRVGTSGAWTDSRTVNILNTDPYANTYLYDASIMHTRGIYATIYSRTTISVPIKEANGGKEGAYDGTGRIGNQYGTEFNPWTNSGSISKNGSINLGTASGSKDNTYTTRFGIEGWKINSSFETASLANVATLPTPEKFTRDNYNWLGGSGNPSASMPESTYVATFFARFAQGDGNGYSYTGTFSANNPAAGTPGTYETMSGDHLSGYINLISNGDIYSYNGQTRYFRLKNATASPIVAHFFASRYTCKPTADLSTAAHFGDVHVKPWGRLEIARLADVRIVSTLSIDQATSYVDAISSGTVTRWYPSGLVCDWEEDRRADLGVSNASTGSNSGSGGGGGGGGGYATIGATGYGGGSGGPARTKGPQNVTCRLISPNTIQLTQSAQSYSPPFKPGQGIRKVSGSGELADTFPTVKSVQGNTLILTDPHISESVSGQNIVINSYEDDLGILFAPELNLYGRSTDKLGTQHLGCPGANGSIAFRADLPVSPGKGGSAGGAVKIVANNIFLNGRIWSIGASGGQGKPATSEDGDGGGGGGGGSGGTIWIIAVNLAGGQGTTNTVGGVTYPPGLGPLCMYDHVYWNFPDLHAHQNNAGNTSATIPLISHLSSYVNVSGNISVNGGEGGGAGQQGAFRPFFNNDVWYSTGSGSSVGVTGWGYDDGGGEAPYSNSTPGWGSNPIGTEHRFLPNHFFYLKFSGEFIKTEKSFDYNDYYWIITVPAIPYRSHQEPIIKTRENGTTYQDGSTTVVDQVYVPPVYEWVATPKTKMVPLLLTPVFTIMRSPNITTNHSAGYASQSGVLAMDLPETAAIEAAILAAQGAIAQWNELPPGDSTGGNQVAITHGPPGSDVEHLYTVSPNGSCGGASTGSWSSIGDLNGTGTSPWANYVDKAYVGVLTKIVASVDQKSQWTMGKGTGGSQGGCGAPGSAGRIRFDVGTLNGWNPNGIRVTANSGTLSGNSIIGNSFFLASWPSGYPQSGTGYPSLDPSKWYDPEHNRTYPGNGPLWEV